ncbi:MAG TPA: hypothetical protein VD997_02860 [Phycisphaerales bacterium]|nr:hypothetical protein [Phycisphaerales bacterium]
MLVCVAVLATTGLADKVVLKSGKTVEGTIAREESGHIWIKTTIGGIEREEFFSADEVASVERGPVAGTTGAAATTAAPAPKKNTGAPKAAVITLGDEENGHMVGIYMTAHQLEQMIPILEKELGTDGTGIVVLRVHSGGGLTLEVQKLSDVIHNEYKKRWRTVAWIDSAISAAAMTSHCMEDIYFTRQGNYGAATQYSGALNATKGRGLEEVLHRMEKISARGGHHPLIARAMQIQQPLSCTVRENGKVDWYGDVTSGEMVINPIGEVLTFNSETALKCGFSKGTCETLEELTKAMGYTELEWVGNNVRGFPWPISAAEKNNMEWRKKVKKDEDLTRKYQVDYTTAINMAAQSPPEDRGKFLGKARQALEQIQRMVKNNPNFSFMAFNMLMDEFDDWVKEQEKLIRELARR